MNSSIKMMLTVSRAWSDENWISGLILWLSISMKLEQRKNKLITRLTLLALSKYCVEIYWVGKESLRSKELAISNIELLWIEWKK